MTTQPTNGSNAGSIRPIDITRTMQDAYLDYAMSVIVARALPDVRDGLKPVHRRILYAVYHDLHLTHDKPHKKSARIVGEVLGKYHPHGDSAVYDAMVRMAQDFSLRYPLIDGQGNFGSIDGDNAAAMRYTEARLAEISQLMLDDLDKDTVEWRDNFDNSLLEPVILPAALPNLLINGASGIAVGMATNIPPHNLGEVVDALAYMIDHFDRVDDIGVEDLTRYIKGPDFPTGGILYRYRVDPKTKEENDVVTQGYSVGKARLIIQAKAHFEEMSRNRSRIVITELPYQTNKTTLIERIASLVRDGKIEGITDLRDESDRTGMRIVIELTRNVDAKDVLAHLFKYTPLQQTFGMQMLALVDGQPVLLSLKRALRLFIEHRQEIIRRRSEFELARARERAHILEGLLKALDILDEVIATIRRSQRVETARTNLMRGFGFSKIQAQAILDMQLRRLAALERKKLQDEYKELLKRIDYLEDLLAHPGKVLGVIKKDLLAIKEAYADPRRTQIVDRTKGTLTTTDLLPEQDVWVSVGANGDLHRHDVVKVTSSALKRSGKHGQVAMLTANTRDYLYLFDEKGQCRRLSIHEIPQDGKRKHLAEMTDFTRRDKITAALALPREAADAAQGYLFLVTEQGIVKRVTVSDFLDAAPLDPVVINVDGKDRLLCVFHTPGDANVILVSSSGKAIRFEESGVRSMGLAAAGVGGMKLKKGERVVYAGLAESDGDLLTATEKGYAKRTSLSEYPTQGRNGGGVVTHKPSVRTGDVSAALVLPPAADLWVAAISARNQALPLSVGDIPRMGRGVQGKQIFAIGIGDTLAAVQMLTLPTPVTAPDGTPSPAKSDKPTKSASRKTASAASAKRSRARDHSVSTKAAGVRTGATVNAKAATKTARPSSATAKAKKPTTKKTTKAASKTAARSRKSTPTKSFTAKSTPAKSKSSAPQDGKSSASKSTRTSAKTGTKVSAKARTKTAQPSSAAAKTNQATKAAPKAASRSRKSTTAKSAQVKSKSNAAKDSKSASPKSTKTGVKTGTKASAKAAAKNAQPTSAPGKAAAKKSAKAPSKSSPKVNQPKQKPASSRRRKASKLQVVASVTQSQAKDAGKGANAQ